MAEAASTKTLQEALGNYDTDLASESVKIASIEVSGLFGRPLNHKIDFSPQENNLTEPQLLILMGPNGSGKTTILRMIDGMLKLDFDIFRQLPFDFATLSLSTGQKLSVKPTTEKDFPLLVTFDDHVAKLARDKQEGYTPQQREPVDAFRHDAIPAMRGIRFQLIDIHRSLALRETSVDTARTNSLGMLRYDGRRTDPQRELSLQVRGFVREAQVNYRKFFIADQLELLPKILGSISGASQTSAQKPELAARVAAIKARSPEMARIGLQTDDPDLDTLMTLLNSESKYDDPASLAVLATYVATQETRSQTRELIAERLLSFEALMDDFLVGKRVRVDPRNGLRIESPTSNLNETDLSSGEYHFLYMMVTALLSHRTGSVIAIDEPELSLHVRWQRKIIGALARCASGAAPVFLFATHSAAISAEHANQVKTLAVEE